jgi:peptidyl-prolyl cis-trans isomerase SurA
MRARARPIISESEIREAFESQQERLGTRPPTVSFRQVIITPEPSDSADAEARRTAEEVYTELQNGGDWEVLARRFSDDPGSREAGGELGWVRQGEGLVPEFERVAFGIRPGVLSPIFSTDFGYHVLEVQRAQGAERRVRHILIQPEITEEDVEQARLRADSVATAIREGANISVLARQYDTPEDQIEVSARPVSSLPPAYGEALADAQTGDVVEPFKVTGTGSDNWAVVRVTVREEERPYTLDDVREQLVVQLQEAKMIEQIVDDLRNRIYVAVRM